MEVTKSRTQMMGHQKVVIVEGTGPASYVAGGDPLDFENFGIHEADLVLAETGAVYDVKYDRTNKKLLWYTSADAVVVVGGTDLSAETVRLIAYGR